MSFDTENGLIRKSFTVLVDWKIGNTKQKLNDTLSVIGYGSGNASNYLEFTNTRLPQYKFKTATWLFQKNTKVINNN